MSDWISFLRKMHFSNESRKRKTNFSWPLTLIMQKCDRFRLLRHHYSESPVIPLSNDIWYRCVAHVFITFYCLIFYRWSNKNNCTQKNGSHDMKQTDSSIIIVRNVYVLTSASMIVYLFVTRSWSAIIGTKQPKVNQSPQQWRGR